MEDHFDVEVCFPFFASEDGRLARGGVFVGLGKGDGGLRDWEGLGLDCGVKYWVEGVGGWHLVLVWLGGCNMRFVCLGDDGETGIREGKLLVVDVGVERSWVVRDLVDEHA